MFPHVAFPNTGTCTSIHRKSHEEGPLTFSSVEVKAATGELFEDQFHIVDFLQATDGWGTQGRCKIPVSRQQHDDPPETPLLSVNSGSSAPVLFNNHLNTSDVARIVD